MTILTLEARIDKLDPYGQLKRGLDKSSPYKIIKIAGLINQTPTDKSSPYKIIKIAGMMNQAPTE